MATFKDTTTLKLRTTKDGDLEDVTFQSGAEVHIVQRWDRFFLIKDDAGHFYNVLQSKILDTPE